MFGAVDLGQAEEDEPVSGRGRRRLVEDVEDGDEDEPVGGEDA